MIKKITNQGDHKCEGFTIIESMVVIFVFAIILGAVLTSITMIYRTQSYSLEQSLAIDEARRGIDIMAKEIRKATYGDNGAHPIEKGAGKEFVFYSDVDNDGAAERVRYYLAMVQSGLEVKECVAMSSGASCSVSFPNFFTGNLKTAKVKVSTEGNYNHSTTRYSEFFVDGIEFGNPGICYNDCTQCAGAWEGTQTFDVTASAAADYSLQFTMDSRTQVTSGVCAWQEPGHAMKARFELSWTSEIPEMGYELRKGVIEPVGDPVTYPLDQEQSVVITSYVRNAPPIFSYYDSSGNQITTDPSILGETKMMRLFMVVNINPARAPEDYDLEQYIQLRNLKD
jgi:prepilin-type N-terminal cleavage/methylation domain-containing protein